jgi:2-amino-4-hydroxy-6-hydroxymethyldihydropteridine diphosphokinase
MKKKVKSKKSKVKRKSSKKKAGAHLPAGGHGGRVPVRSKKMKPKIKPEKKAVAPRAASQKAKPTQVAKADIYASKAKTAEKEKEKVKPGKQKPGQYLTVYLSLGSNVGDREEYIEQAITLLRETPGIKVIRRASNFETEPEGKKGQAQFINSAVEISTNLPPKKLLELTQSFEDTLGRERGVEWGPRTIDIDILLYGTEIMSDDTLTIPHPLMHERLFVLEPLKEIAPQVTHPVLDRTITELYKDKKAEANETSDEDIAGYRDIKRGIADDYERW